MTNVIKSLKIRDSNFLNILAITFLISSMIFTLSLRSEFPSCAYIKDIKKNNGQIES